IELRSPIKEVEKEQPKVLAKDRNYINAPCFSLHMKYVQSCQDAGCKNAVEFVNRVCSDFHECMTDTNISYWHCKPYICRKLSTMPKHDHCLDYLFKCQ
ncbi:hypothetical protein OESDEN_17501, partial [Oesophagostomum dentatum]